MPFETFSQYSSQASELAEVFGAGSDGVALKIDLGPALKQLARNLNTLEKQQVPFAAAQMLTATARDVAAAETAALSQVFDKPTPFTQRAFGVIPARKSNLTATVFARDAQARYLDPYEGGGVQVLGGKRAILTPRDLAVNQYGNLPKGKLVALKGKPDIFVGEVKTKNGMIGGVWQRIDQPGQPLNKRIRGVGRVQGPSRAGRLKLLIQFTRPAQVTKQLHYMARAQAVVAKRLAPNWNKALAAALASAR